VHKYINYAIILCKASLLHNFNDGLQLTGKISVFGTVNKMLRLEMTVLKNDRQLYGNMKHEGSRNITKNSTKKG
jgi:hypothetical protein